MFFWVSALFTERDGSHEYGRARASGIYASRRDADSICSRQLGNATLAVSGWQVEEYRPIAGDSFPYTAPNGQTLWYPGATDAPSQAVSIPTA